MTRFVEYDGAGNIVDSFDVELYSDPNMQQANQHVIADAWLERTNQNINRMIDRVHADCVLDYWYKRDPSYVNHWAPMMCYLECEHHGPQIGSRADYPHEGTSPAALCPECSEDMMYAIDHKMLTVRQIEQGPAEHTQQIIAVAREKRSGNRK